MNGIFGWSYPPGCSGTPLDEFPDESRCVYCGQDLPEKSQDGSWDFYGFCDAECALREHLALAKFSDDETHGTCRKTAGRALDEIANVWRRTSTAGKEST